MNAQLVYTMVGGRYRILEKVTEGSTTEVFKALDVRLQRVVALKILREAYQEQEALARSFEDEARAMARITHRNIVRVYDYDQAEGHSFTVMEYVRGRTLKAYLSGTALPAEEESARLAEQLLEGLSAVRRAGITHASVRPEDVLVNPAGTLKIAGFGIGKVVEAEGVDQVGMRFSNSQYLASQATPGHDPHVVDLIMCRLPSGALLCEPQHRLEVSTPQNLDDRMLLAASSPRRGVLEKASGREAEGRHAGSRHELDALRGGYRAAERVAAGSDPTIAMPVVNQCSPQADTIRFPTIRGTEASRAALVSHRSAIRSLFSLRTQHRERVPARTHDRRWHNPCAQGRPETTQRHTPTWDGGAPRPSAPPA